MSTIRDALLADSKSDIEAAGFAVVKATTYRNLQERARLAERQVEWEREQVTRAEQWGRDAHAELRRIDERLRFVYGEARAAGLTVEDLSYLPTEPPTSDSSSTGGETWTA